MNLSDTDTNWLFHTREIKFPVLHAIYHQPNELMFIIVWGNTMTILLYTFIRTIVAYIFTISIYVYYIYIN